FFFQAEDGIRDGHVTGVQTCALPICGAWPRARQIDVIVAIVVSVILMSPVVLGAVLPHFPLHWLRGLAWWWYVPLGTAVTVAVGLISSLVGRSDGLTAGRSQTPT